MPITPSLSRRLGAFTRGALLAAAMAASAAATVNAAPRHARLSADLADHLNAGSQQIRVIVHGTKAEVDALAARYNLVVKRYLESGAVFVLTAGQLDAVSRDTTQDHLSGDVRIKSLGDYAAESMGADQLWEGAGALPNLTGNGVTVAVIDSGIDTSHAALKKRV